MRERSEIAAGADRAFFWNDRRHTPIEQLTERVDDFETDAAEAEGKHIRAQQHHRAHLGFRKRIANSASVTANKIELELGQSIVRDANIGQFAKTRADTVNDIVARNDTFDDPTRS